MKFWRQPNKQATKNVPNRLQKIKILKKSNDQLKAHARVNSEFKFQFLSEADF